MGRTWANLRVFFATPMIEVILVSDPYSIFDCGREGLEFARVRQARSKLVGKSEYQDNWKSAAQWENLDRPGKWNIRLAAANVSPDLM